MAPLSTDAPPGLAIVDLAPATAHWLEGADVFDNPVDPAQLAAFVADPGHLLVFAHTGTDVLGFASGTILLHPDKPPAFFLNEVDVAPAHRRRGIATALCRRLMVRARAAGCRGFWLATEAQNAAARGLYRALGGRETDRIVVWDWDGALDA